MHSLTFRCRIVRYLAAAALLLPASLSLAAGPQPHRPPITGIAGVVFATTNLPAERAFYTKTLGWASVVSPEFPNGLRFYGDPRQTVDIHPAARPGELAFDHVIWATTDVEAMRVYLASKGVAVPGAVTVVGNGDKYIRVHDPEGNTVEFLQRPAGYGSGLPHAPNSLSGRIIHAGFMVRSATQEDRFYHGILGFHLYWEGGMHAGTLDWVSMQVPDGTDWLEYMLNAGDHPSARTIGVDDHISLGVKNLDTVVAALQQRGWPAGAEQQHQKQAGRDGKYQLNLYDPDGTRIEFMEFAPYTQPCCHAFTGKQPGPDQQ